ncbi:Tripartite ATP-independent periplasmic transporters, DctQ component [Rhodobacteraceae bacterium THAF1]|uniref:TRAP transporter small permease n=1 Tax=Palleronia sp. THAF1 TaxID=2587842 RepID=UPI000F3D4153|nr:TRAP transporter small permease [Palleronia sp. THAF1]QFU08763.1 Tripartite ATP-independent periplasmic transporter, DctQ component [Palleronia sp. THAF1]VDC31240.1 Tripartite ATP-independent periplasmic transporters, DctQ component [Rhodobacteraceae bacterium THAF1]
MEPDAPTTANDRLALALGLGPGIVLLLTALLTLADVIGRNLFDAPVPGATELTELALVAITFLLYPRVAWRDTHISVDLLDGFMGRAARRLQRVLAAVIGTLAFGALAWRIWILGERVTGYGDVTPYLRLPLGPVYYAMALLCGVTAAAYLARLALVIAAPRRLPDADAQDAKKGIE